jgi:thiol-disulfide isomerase/thioredoxin
VALADDEVRGAADTRSVWYILRQPNTMGLLHGLPQRLSTAILPSHRTAAMWTGIEPGGSVRLQIDVEGDAKGEIFVGLFADARWWTEGPIQMRRFAGPGQFTVENLIPGQYYIGAMIGAIPDVKAVGVHESWPSPVEITRESSPEIRLLVSDQFTWEAVHVRDPRNFIAAWPKMDPARLITVRVVDREGKPVPFCRVTFAERRLDEPGQVHMYHEVGTDSMGYAYCDQIDGLFSLTAHFPDFAPDSLSSRWQMKKTANLHNAKDRPIITITRDPYATGTARVVGRVHDQHGRALKEFHVNLSRRVGDHGGLGDATEHGMRVPIVDRDGRFELPGLPSGTYKVTASAFDYPTHAYDREGTDFTIPDEPDATVDIEVELEAKQLLYGRATFDDGTPVFPGTWTAWFSTDRSPFRAQYFSLNTQRDGSFRVTLSNEERNKLLANSAGLIELSPRGSPATVAKVHVDRLSIDPEEPFVLVVPKAKADTKNLVEAERSQPENTFRSRGSPVDSSTRSVVGDVELVATDGRTHRLSDYRGKPVLLNIFTTWCGPCQQGMPHLAELHSCFADAGLVILAICRDEEPEVAEDYARRKQLPFPILVDSQGVLKQLRDQDDRPVVPRNEFGTISLPTNVLLDQDHRIVLAEIGYNPTISAKLNRSVIRVVAASLQSLSESR